MPEGFVKLKSFWSVEEANLAKMHLEDEGIPAELEGAMLIATAWLDANAIGGVKLLVSAADLERSREILEARPEAVPSEEWADESTASDSEPEDWQTERSTFQDHDEDTGSTPSTLRRMRSLKGPIIWIFLTPILFAVAMQIVSLLLFLFQ